MEVDIDTIGMLSFINRHSTEMWMTELYNKWIDLLKNLEVDKEIRRDKDVDLWFRECYQMKDEFEIVDSGDVQKVGRLHRFEDILDDRITSIDCSFKKLLWKDFKENIERIGVKWVDSAVLCIVEEHNLMKEYEQRLEFSQEYDRKNQIDKYIIQLQKHKQLVKTELEKLQRESDELSQLSVELENLKTAQKDVERAQTLQNKKLHTPKDLPSKIERKTRDVKNKSDKLIRTFQKLQQLFKDIGEWLRLVVNELLVNVKEWQKELQKKFAELAAYPEFHHISDWCYSLSKLFHELHIEQLSMYVQLLRQYHLSDDGIVELVTLIHQHFIKSTFLVTDQDSYIMKIDKKHLPKFTLRALGIPPQQLTGTNVLAYLVYEDDLNDCWREDQLQISEVQQKFQGRFKNAGQKVSFSMNKDRNAAEACFNSLQIDNKNFERPSSEKQVHEEKYRIVFVATLAIANSTESLQCAALSLPVVVTTGANQGCQSLASIMWQCFSTDVFEFPLHHKEALPCSLVLDMLDAKIRKICSQQGLTDESKQHLRRRLIKKCISKHDEDPYITLKAFCFDKMEKSECEDDSENNMLDFSFWKWFMGIYNLINTYLGEYWKQGWIHGFVSKEDAVAMLKKCPPRDGMFILRFSDNNLINSQGIKSVFGHLTACVMTLKEDPSGQKKKKIYSRMDVAGHNLLKEKNLSKILRGTKDRHKADLYRCLYPGQPTREQTFDQQLSSESVNKKYLNPEEMWIIDLEQALCDIDKYEGKHCRSVSEDSGFDALSPPEVKTETIPKRPRVCGNEDRHPTLTQMLSSPSNSPFPLSPGQMSDSLSTNEPSPQPSIPSMVQDYNVSEYENRTTAFLDQCVPCGNFGNASTNNAFEPTLNSLSVCAGNSSNSDCVLVSSTNGMGQDSFLASLTDDVPGQIELFVDSNNQVVQTIPTENPNIVEIQMGTDVDDLIQMFANLPAGKQEEFWKRLQDQIPTPSPQIGPMQHDVINSSSSFGDLSESEMKEAMDVNSGGINTGLLESF